MAVKYFPPPLSMEQQDPDIKPENIKKGIDIGGIVGTLIDVGLDPDWIEANIRKGVDIAGKVGTLVEKKEAMGTIPPYTLAPSQLRTVTVSGLSFRPSVVILQSHHASITSWVAVTVDLAEPSPMGRETKTMRDTPISNYCNAVITNIKSNSFDYELRNNNGGDSDSYPTLTWYAIGQ